MDNILPNTQADHFFLFIYQHPKIQKHYTEKLRSKQYYLPLLNYELLFLNLFCIMFLNLKIYRKNYIPEFPHANIHKQGEESSPFPNHKFNSVSDWVKEAGCNDIVNNSFKYI